MGNDLAKFFKKYGIKQHMSTPRYSQEAKQAGRKGKTLKGNLSDLHIMTAEPKEELPPGFRFHPTDEELITFCLMNKINDATFTGRAIADVDLNKCEPWELPAKAKMGEKEWYFFSLRDRKYPTGVRTNRATSTGYWKTTGKDKEIFNSTLVFYRGRAPRGEKSNWVMHEYRLHSKSGFRTSQRSCAGIKKYPTNQSRAANPYNLKIGPSDPNHHQFPYGRNYMTSAEVAELSRVLRVGGGGGGGSSSITINLPIQPQFNYTIGGGGGGGGVGGAAGEFTISGLNLNLGGPASQPMLRTIPRPQIHHQGPPSMNHHHQVHDVTNSAMMNVQAGYGTVDMYNSNNPNGGSGNRFMNMDPCACVDLENY
ncbi:unnamed protein product [Malus baccata var. baccata]